MASSTRSRFSTQPLTKEPDPFALDAPSEEFFAVGDRPTPVEKIELELEEEDMEVVRRSMPEVVLRRRRYRRLVTRVVSAVGVLALAALGKSALSPANASAYRPAAVAMSQQPVRLLEAPAPTETAPPTPRPPASTAATEIAAPAPPAEVAAPVTEPAKVAHHAAKKSDDFADLDVKIDVPKIDVSLE